MSWPTVALGEIACLLRNGMSIKQSPGARGMPITRIETIASGSVNLSRCGYANLERKDCSGWLLEYGDILISHINSLAHLGKCAIFEERAREVVHGMNLLNLRVDQSVALPRFILHALRSKRFVAQISTIAKKSVNQASFNISTFKELEIPLPPLEEQRRIAAILDKASTIKQKSAKASALAESLCIARLEQLVATNETLLVGRRLEDLCILGAPITYGILQPGPDLDGGIPYVRPSEIKNSRIDIKSLKRTSPEIAAKYRKSELQEGDILFTIVGTIGEAAVVPAELEGANITQSSARIRIDTAQADPAYVYYSLKSQHASRQISRDRLGVAVERLNLHHVRDMEILCLPMEIQNAYAKEVHCMMQLTSRHSLAARHVSSLIQSLTSSLLASGERQ